MAECHWVCVLLTTELTPCPSARWQQEGEVAAAVGTQCNGIGNRICFLTFLWGQGRGWLLFEDCKKTVFPKHPWSRSLIQVVFPWITQLLCSSLLVWFGVEEGKNLMSWPSMNWYLLFAGTMAKTGSRIEMTWISYGAAQKAALYSSTFMHQKLIQISKLLCSTLMLWFMLLCSRVCIIFSS